MKREKGITLVALVVTIVILIILAVISINAVFGENGLISSTEKGEVEYTHATVWERMEMAYSDYWAGKVANEKKDLISYLQEKEIIGTEQTSNGGYKINTVALAGAKLALGNGTDDQNDVYKLEETVEANGDKTYSVNYYGESGPRNLGVLEGDKKKDLPQTASEFKVGKYVQLPYNGTTIECVVMYDEEYNKTNKTNYGIQMIATDVVGENIGIGNDCDLTQGGTSEQMQLAVESYNSAIETLNNEAKKYVNESNNMYVTSARCVGSVPNDPYSESKDLVNLAEKATSGKWTVGDTMIKDVDSNSNIDFLQMQNMKSLGVDIFDTTSKSNYWVSSRAQKTSGAGEYYGLEYFLSRTYNPETIAGFSIYSNFYYKNFYRSNVATNKLRPIFIVNPTAIDRVQGEGTKEDPLIWTE